MSARAGEKLNGKSPSKSPDLTGDFRDITLMSWNFPNDKAQAKKTPARD